MNVGNVETQADQQSSSGHNLCVSYLGREKALNNGTYAALDKLHVDALTLFEDEYLNIDNTVITYLDEQKTEILLTNLPVVGQQVRLRIRCIQPVCTMCLNPFGIIDEQLLYECPNISCGEQYCHGCIQAVRGPTCSYSFTCLICKETGEPHRNTLIEEHIIWKSFCKVYGVEKFRTLISGTEFFSCNEILNDIRSRQAHVSSRFRTFTEKLNKMQPDDHSHDQLARDVDHLLGKLTNLINALSFTDEQMNERNISVEDCLQRYKSELKTLNTVSKNLINATQILEEESDSILVNTHVTCNHHQDVPNELTHLSSNQSIPAIDEILKDINLRKHVFSLILEPIKSCSTRTVQSIAFFEDIIKQAEQLIMTFENIEGDLRFLRQSLAAIYASLNDYDDYLRHDIFKHIPCSNFIYLLETLRTETERLEMRATFPNVANLMTKWQSIDCFSSAFKPKVIELFKAVKDDLIQGLTRQNGIYTIPYRIGVIGDTSVGKSSLIQVLGNIESELSATISCDRSTFGYLQFDTATQACSHTDQTLSISFVDIEGATDACDSQLIGNYRELIVRADCDLYLIVFDRPFQDQHQEWKNFIELECRRKCLLVWNKTDELFLKLFKEQTRHAYDGNTKKSLIVKDVLNRIRLHTSSGFNREKLSDEVYLTAAECDSQLNRASFATFDLEKLKTRIKKMALEDSRIERISRSALLSSTTIINTCFRRGYFVSTRYSIIAAAVSPVPLVGEIPNYFGRKEINSAFGIDGRLPDPHSPDESTLKDYLLKQKLSLPESYLKSGCFDYLAFNTENQTPSNAPITAEMIKPNKPSKSGLINSVNTDENITASISARITHVFTIAGAVSAHFIDDFSRLAIPMAKISGKTLSTVCTTAGFALLPLFAVWSYYSTKKQLRDHLHLLCNDLLLVLELFIDDVCHGCLTTTGSLELCTRCFP